MRINMELVEHMCKKSFALAGAYLSGLILYDRVEDRDYGTIVYPWFSFKKIHFLALVDMAHSVSAKNLHRSRSTKLALLPHIVLDDIRWPVGVQFKNNNCFEGYYEGQAEFVNYNHLEIIGVNEKYRQAGMCRVREEIEYKMEEIQRFQRDVNDLTNGLNDLLKLMHHDDLIKKVI